MEFTWNSIKNHKNKEKHGISFEEAETVFYDENALHMPDSTHSLEEDRFVLLGMSSKFRVLVVCHCYRENDEIVRIISARKATRGEQKAYEERL